jgi:putative oxidoreductase
MDFPHNSLWADRALGVLRIVSALLFLEHGTTKFLGFPPGASPAAFSLSWFAGLIELVGGALLVVGLWVRPAAFIMSGTMAVAYWVAHAPRSFFPVNNGGDAAILFCFVFLYFVFAGGGAWSLDAVRGAAGRRAR